MVPNDMKDERNNVLADSNVVIVIDGLDQFKEQETGQESIVEYWLPKNFPPRIRVVVSLSPDSRTYHHISKWSCPVGSINESSGLIEERIKDTEAMAGSEDLMVSKKHMETIVDIAYRWLSDYLGSIEPKNNKVERTSKTNMDKKESIASGTQQLLNFQSERTQNQEKIKIVKVDFPEDKKISSLEVFEPNLELRKATSEKTQMASLKTPDQNQGVSPHSGPGSNSNQEPSRTVASLTQFDDKDNLKTETIKIVDPHERRKNPGKAGKSPSQIKEKAVNRTVSIEAAEQSQADSKKPSNKKSKPQTRDSGSKNTKKPTRNIQVEGSEKERTDQLKNKKDQSSPEESKENSASRNLDKTGEFGKERGSNTPGFGQSSPSSEQELSKRENSKMNFLRPEGTDHESGRPESFNTLNTFASSRSMHDRRIKTTDEIKPSRHSAFTMITFLLGLFIPKKTEALSEFAVPVERINQVYSHSELNYEEIRNISKPGGLFKLTFKLWSNKITREENIVGTIVALSITKKGLTYEEVRRAISVSPEDFYCLMALLSDIVIFHEGFWRIGNESYRAWVFNNFSKKLLEMQKKIAEALDLTPNSIRKLEEQTFHLSRSHNFLKLKQVISQIENFLMMFNPMNKYELCRYWQELEEHGYDPVSEFNKSVEMFDINYKPAPENIFLIIFQVSRFLKEFADFETSFTPEFRHPNIKNKYILAKETDLELISFYKDVSKDSVKCSKLFSIPKNIPQFFNIEKKNNSEDKITKKEEEYASDGKTLLMNYLKDIGLEEELKMYELVMNGDEKPLSPWETVNVEIPVQREETRSFLMSLITMKKSRKKRLMRQFMAPVAFNVSPEELSESTEEEKEKNNNVLTSLFAKSSEQSALSDIDLFIPKERSRTFYYYKRWIWQMFPWACICSHPGMNYSKNMKQCLTSSIEYLSPEYEYQVTFSAAQLAIEAKVKKKQMYSNKTPVRRISRKLSSSNNSVKRDTVVSSSPLHRTLEKGPLDSMNGSSRSKRLEPLKEIAPTESVCSPSFPRKRVSTEKDESLQKKSEPLPFENNSFFITSQYLNPESYKLFESKAKKAKAITPLSPVVNTKTRLAVNRSGHWEFLVENSRLDRASIIGVIGKPSDKAVMSSILSVRSALNDLEEKEVRLMEEKLIKLKEEHNFILAEINRKAKDLKKVKVGDYHLGMLPLPNIEESIRQRSIEIEAIMHNTDDKLKVALYDRSRFRKMIELCMFNNSYNEKWIDELNFFIANLNKMIKWEKERIKSSESEVSEAIRLTNEYYKAHMKKKKNYEELIAQVKHTVRIQKRLDLKIDGTNDQLYSAGTDIQVRNHEKMIKESSTENVSTPMQNKMKHHGGGVIEELEYFEKMNQAIRESLSVLPNQSVFDAEKYESAMNNARIQNLKIQKDQLLISLEKKQEILNNKKELLNLHKGAYIITHQKANDEENEMNFEEVLAERKLQSNNLSEKISEQEFELSKRIELVSILQGSVHSMCCQLGLEPGINPEEILQAIASESKHVFSFIKQENPEIYECLKTGKSKMIQSMIGGILAQKRKEMEANRGPPTFYSAGSQDDKPFSMTNTNKSFFKNEESPAIVLKN